MSLKFELEQLDADDVARAAKAYEAKILGLREVRGRDEMLKEVSVMRSTHPGLTSLIYEVLNTNLVDTDTVARNERIMLGMGAAIALQLLIEIADLQEMPQLD
jgi:hypothetical protein